MVSQRTFNPPVPGSNPGAPTIYKNSPKYGYTGERELGTKSTNYRKRQEDTEPDSLVRFQQRVSIYGDVA